MLAQAKQALSKRICNKVALARALVENQPVVVDHMGLTQEQVIGNLSALRNLCPVHFNTKSTV